MPRIQVYIVSLSLSSIQEDTYLLMLSPTGRDRILPIVLDYGEAQPILTQMDLGEEPFPFTDAVMYEMASDYGVRVTEVAVEYFSEGLFEATVRVEREGNVHTYPARLSDAISLSMRAACPIYVESGVMDAAGVDSRLLLQDNPAGDISESADGETGRETNSQVLLDSIALMMASKYPEDWVSKCSDEVLSFCLGQAIAQEQFEIASVIRDEQARRKAAGTSGGENAGTD